jgi:hypothetical protein
MVATDKRGRVPLGRAGTGLADRFPEIHWTSRLNLKALLPERAVELLPATVERVIEFTGLEMPLLGLPDEKGLVVLGNRRAIALKGMRHYAEIPIFIANSAQDLARWCDADKQLTSWDQGPEPRPWSWSERGALLDHTLGVLRRSTLSGAGRGSVVEILAAYFGVHEIQLRNAMYLLRYERLGGPEGERAGSLMKLVEAGEIAPQTAYRKLRDGEPVSMTYASVKPLMSAKAQERALRNAAGALSGLVMGLRAMGDVSPDLPAAARAELVPPIQDARRLLARIARQLQGLEEPVDESNNTDKGDA